MKSKCAYIYLSQTTKTEGTYQGNFGGLGVSNNGVGLGIGQGSGVTDQETQTKLAELFRPIENKSLTSVSDNSLSHIFSGSLIIVMGSLVSKYIPQDSFIFNIKNIIQIIQTIFYLIGMMTIIHGVLKMYNSDYVEKKEFSNEEFKIISDIYNQIDYNYEKNTIELEESSYPASRENFIKLIKEKANLMK